MTAGAAHAPTWPAEAADDAAARKAFESRRAAAALRKWILSRTDPEDGPVMYFLSRWGLSRACADLDALDRALVDIGVPPPSDVRRVVQVKAG